MSQEVTTLASTPQELHAAQEALSTNKDALQSIVTVATPAIVSITFILGYLLIIMTGHIAPTDLTQDLGFIIAFYFGTHLTLTAGAAFTKGNGNGSKESGSKGS